MQFSTYAFFAIATAAYERSKTPTNESPLGQDALAAIIFSAITLEAFINEVGTFATMPAVPNPPSIAAFGALLEEAERSRVSVQLKHLLASTALAGSAYERGRQPFQDFALLFDLRNALVHHKTETTKGVLDPATGLAVDIVMNERQIVKQLQGKNILTDKFPSDRSPLYVLVSTPVAAKWACATASAMMKSVVQMMPDCAFKEALKSLGDLYRLFG